MNKFIVVFSLLIIAGCGDSGDDPVRVSSIQTTEDLTNALEGNGSRPDLDQSATAAGTDANDDGIRDDIKNFIDNMVATPSQRSALTDIAKIMQEIQVASELNEVTALDFSNRLLRPVVCLADEYNNPSNASQALAKIEAFTANTRTRAEKYHLYNQLRDGAVTRLPQTITCQSS